MARQALRREGTGVHGSPLGDAPPVPAPPEPVTAAASPGASAPVPVTALLARHWLFALFLVPAIALRALTMLGFRWALWFNDSYQYVEYALGGVRPDPTRPSAYSLYLRILRPLHSYAVVTITQHAMGIGVGVMVYALLRRRFKVHAAIATLAAAPALFDAYQIQLEHLVMADVLFGFLLTAAVTVAMWRPRPTTWQLVTAGVALGAAAVTRSIGLPLLGIFAVYLLIRRVRLRLIAACVLAFAVPVGGYTLWFHHWYHQYALTESTGAFLYVRVMAFADCTKFTVPPDEMPLCVTTPPGHRMVPEDYIWAKNAPLRRFPPPEFSALTNKLAKDFSIRAIEAQPLSYARVSWADTWRAFAWQRKVFPDLVTYDEYEFVSASRGPARYPATGQGFGSPFPSGYIHGDAATRVVQPYAGIMVAYQKYFFVPGTILGVLLLLGFAGMALRWRRLGGEALLPWAIAAALIVLPAATVEFDYRYLLPTLPFATLATAIMVSPVGRWFTARRGRRGQGDAAAGAHGGRTGPSLRSAASDPAPSRAPRGRLG